MVKQGLVLLLAGFGSAWCSDKNLQSDKPLSLKDLLLWFSDTDIAIDAFKSSEQHYVRQYLQGLSDYLKTHFDDCMHGSCSSKQKNDRYSIIKQEADDQKMLHELVEFICSNSQLTERYRAILKLKNRKKKNDALYAYIQECIANSAIAQKDLFSKLFQMLHDTSFQGADKKWHQNLALYVIREAIEQRLLEIVSSAESTPAVSPLSSTIELSDHVSTYQNYLSQFLQGADLTNNQKEMIEREQEDQIMLDGFAAWLARSNQLIYPKSVGDYFAQLGLSQKIIDELLPASDIPGAQKKLLQDVFIFIRVRFGVHVANEIVLHAIEAVR